MTCTSASSYTVLGIKPIYIRQTLPAELLPKPPTATVKTKTPSEVLPVSRMPLPAQNSSLLFLQYWNLNSSLVRARQLPHCCTVSPAQRMMSGELRRDPLSLFYTPDLGLAQWCWPNESWVSSTFFHRLSCVGDR